MKRRILYLAAIASSVVWNLMPSQASATACGIGPLSGYDVAGFSCTIGDKTFSDFAYTPSGTAAVQVPDTSVTVTPITGPDIGLQFNALWSASAGQTSDGAISFDVAVTGGGPLLIKDASLVQVAGISGDASASVAELACGPDGCTPGVIALLTFQNTGGTKTSDNTIFTPVGSLEVVKDIGVSGGSCAATTTACTASFAQLSVVQDTFSQTSVPEPASLAIFGSALLGLGWVGRRRRKHM